jgi:hypothetical protein
MPITFPNMTAAIAAGISSSSFTGISIIQLASGIASGIIMWLPFVQVQSVDSGTAGAGATVLPLVVPPILLQNALLSTYITAGHLGVFAPLEATGLALGLSNGFAQGVIQMTHAGVGSGTGVVKFLGPPAHPYLMQGMASAGMTGPFSTMKAQAISQALLIVLQALTFPVPIIGPPSPSPASGVGIGKVI